MQDQIQLEQLELVRGWRPLSRMEGARLQRLRSARAEHFRGLLARSRDGGARLSAIRYGSSQQERAGGFPWEDRIQRQVDRMPQDYFPPVGEPSLGQVRRYLFREEVNGSETFEQVVLGTIRRARVPEQRATTEKLWEDVRARVRAEDAEGAADGIWTLANWVNQLHAVPGRLSEDDTGRPYQETRDPIRNFEIGLQDRFGSRGTQVETIDRDAAVYTLRTISLDHATIGQAQIQASPEDVIRTEERKHVLFRDMTADRFDFLFVQLPGDPNEELLAKPILFEGKRYRMDVFGGSLVKSGKAIAVEEGATQLFSYLFDTKESVYYALRALFPQVLGGVRGNIRARAYALDPEGDPEGENLTFLLRDGETRIQLHDGWGYVKKSLAAQMEAGGLEREKRQPTQAGGKAGYQMLQWQEQERPGVIRELVTQGLQRWTDLTHQAGVLEQQLRAATEQDERFRIRKQLQENLEARYSVLTTGGPRLETAVAMPVSGNRMVVPSNSERFRHRGRNVSVLRSPADKPNWHPVRAQDVERNTKRSELLAGMEAIQYTWTGLQDGAMSFFKGMLGVIDDDQWPDAWKGLDLVVTQEDRKLYEKWRSKKDRDATKAKQEDFSMQGNLVANQWFGAGTVVGVPNKIQKWLGGDYDGDEISMLLGTTNPQLQQQIEDEFDEDQLNPKLPKTYSPDRGGSRKAQLVAMRSTNVQDWSSIAARIRALPAPARTHLAKQLRQSSILAPDDLQGLDDEQAMWKEVFTGIKVGTDAFKTSVPASSFERRASWYSTVLNQYNLYQLPYRKALMKTIDQAGPPNLENGAWRDVFFSTFNKAPLPRGLPVMGIPARVLETMIFNLIPPQQRLQLSAYHQRWLKEERGFR